MTDTVWYGELRATRGNTIVIKDTSLPEASKGRIYLYNTERNAIIEYDESIVTPKLFPLDEEQTTLAQKQYKAAWEEARKQLVGRTKVGSPAEPEATAETKKPDMEEIVIEDSLLPSDDDDTDDDDDLLDDED